MSPYSFGYAQPKPQALGISKVTLNKYGWQPLPKILGPKTQLISFNREGSLLVGFTARETYGVASREHPGLSFHILRFTSDGKVDLAITVPTNDYFHNGFYLGPNDEIFVRANEKFQFLSKIDLADGASAEWKTLAACPEDCRITQSVSRQTFVLRVPADRPNDSYIVIAASSASPHVLETCQQMASQGEKITDHFSYWSGVDGNEPFTRRFSFCTLDHPEELPLGWVGGLLVVNDTSFLKFGFVHKLQGRVELIKADGQSVFRHEMPKGVIPYDFLGPWATSNLNGTRFAFIVSTWRGGSNFLDISGRRVERRVVVLSETGKELASIQISLNHRHDFDFSLSPDGRRIAILDQNEVTIRDLTELDK
jgi:hypothetical protein